jgi:hypothetical protein
VPVGFGDLQGDYRNPGAVCRWIEANVPCFKGLIGEEWTSALFNEARRRHISDLTVSAALAIAKKDGYNFAGIIWSPGGPVYAPTRSRALADAVMALESTALIFGEKFIRDARVRENYLKQARAASQEIQAYAYSGEMSAEEAALRVNELRNALLDAGRLKNSDVGRAVAELEKATGKRWKSCRRNTPTSFSRPSSRHSMLPSETPSSWKSHAPAADPAPTSTSWRQEPARLERQC